VGLKIGLVGLGFMGKMHWGCWRKTDGADVVAVCDVDERKRAGDWSAVDANIGESGGSVDLSNLKAYAAGEDLFADADVDVVDITLPTYLHADYTIKALEAGKHVICEKPMAITAAEAQRMVDAASASGKKLFVGHCIRYWPAYAEARRIIKSGEHGKVLSAMFRRLGATPLGSWQNWMQDPAKSGAAVLDLHIHDADFVLYTFGVPKSVTCRGSGFDAGRYDHTITTYDYGDGSMVAAEGGWIYAPEFGFEMSFNIAMEKASLKMGGDLVLKLLPKSGGVSIIDPPQGDGYELELADFAACISGDKDSEVVTPDSARQSVRLIELEVESAKTGATVDVTL
jgi:predicted dehydrogenase